MKKLYMRVSGERELILGKVKVCKYGRMAPYMKDGGKAIKQMDEEG